MRYSQGKKGLLNIVTDLECKIVKSELKLRTLYIEKFLFYTHTLAVRLSDLLIGARSATIICSPRLYALSLASNVEACIYDDISISA